MAHLDRTGVYECGIRVVLDSKLEARWDLAGTAGLEAEIVSDGVLVGFVPHVEGSEDFTDEQIVEQIATTRYTVEGLHPPTDGAGTQERPPSPPREDERPRWTDRLRRGRQ